MGRGEVVNLCNAGYLTRVRHGYYRMADAPPANDAELISAILPQAIICMESALFYYGYSDYTPRQWSITVPRTVTRSKLDIGGGALRVYYVQEEIYGLGKSMGNIQGVELPVYDRERTLCDCVKHRSRLDSETFAKTLAGYAKDPEKNLQRLSAYAKKMRVYKKVIEFMEVLLHG